MIKEFLLQQSCGKCSSPSACFHFMEEDHTKAQMNERFLSSEVAGEIRTPGPVVTYQQTRSTSSHWVSKHTWTFSAKWNQLWMPQKLKYLTKIRKSYKSYAHHVIMVMLVIYVQRWKTTQSSYLHSDAILELSLQNNLWHQTPVPLIPEYCALELVSPCLAASAPETLSQPYRPYPDCNHDKRPVILLQLHRTVGHSPPLTK